MKICRRVVVIAIACVLFASATAWSEENGLSEDDIRNLCAIYRKIPVEKTITINSVDRRRIKPIVVHRCQQVVFRVVDGDATIFIMDDDLMEANANRLNKEYDAVAGNAIVLRIPSDRPIPPSIEVPEGYPYPDHGRPVTIRYYTECYDPKRNTSYECEGGSAPIIIIPRFP